jgi:hypothetical protein
MKTSRLSECHNSSTHVLRTPDDLIADQISADKGGLQWLPKTVRGLLATAGTEHMTGGGGMTASEMRDRLISQQSPQRSWLRIKNRPASGAYCDNLAFLQRDQRDQISIQ